MLERGSPVPVPTMMTCLPQKLVASTISLPYVGSRIVVIYIPNLVGWIPGSSSFTRLARAR